MKVVVALFAIAPIFGATVHTLLIGSVEVPVWVLSIAVTTLLGVCVALWRAVINLLLKIDREQHTHTERLYQLNESEKAQWERLNKLNERLWGVWRDPPDEGRGTSDA